MRSILFKGIVNSTILAICFIINTFELLKAGNPIWALVALGASILCILDAGEMYVAMGVLTEESQAHND